MEEEALVPLARRGELDFESKLQATLNTYMLVNTCTNAEHMRCHTTEERSRFFFVRSMPHAFHHDTIATFWLRNGKQCGKVALAFLGVARDGHHTHVVRAQIDVPRTTTQTCMFGATCTLLPLIVHGLPCTWMNRFTSANNTRTHHHLNSCSLPRVKPSRPLLQESVKLELTSVRGRHPTNSHVWRVENARVSTSAMAFAMLRAGCVSWTYL